MASPQDGPEVPEAIQVAESGSLWEQDIFAVPDSLRVVIDLQILPAFAFVFFIISLMAFKGEKHSKNGLHKYSIFHLERGKDDFFMPVISRW